LGGERVGHLVDRFDHLARLSCMNVLRSGLSARLALVACLTVAIAAVYRPTAAADPTPAPLAAPGVAYDEIARVVPPGSTPPPVGSFADDAAVIAALPPLVVPKAREANYSTLKLLASIPGPFSQFAATMAGRAANRVVADDWKRQNDEFANGRAVRQRTGVLAKFAYYRLRKPSVEPRLNPPVRTAPMSRSARCSRPAGRKVDAVGEESSSGPRTFPRRFSAELSNRAVDHEWTTRKR
jgi:hypothetical protein